MKIVKKLIEYWENTLKLPKQMQDLVNALEEWVTDYRALRGRVEELEKRLERFERDNNILDIIKKMKEVEAPKPFPITKPIYPYYPGPSTPVEPYYPVWTITSTSSSNATIKGEYVKS